MKLKYILLPFELLKLTLSSIPNQPLLFFSLLGFCVHPSWALVFCMLLSYVIVFASEQVFKQFQSHIELCKLIESFGGPDGKLKECIYEMDAEEIMKEIFGNQKLDTFFSIQAKPFFRKNMQKINNDFIPEGLVRFFALEKDTNLLAAGNVVYSSLYTPTYIFLSERLSKMTSYQRFGILHEFGHATLGNSKIMARRSTAIFQCIVVLIIFLFSTSNYWLIFPLSLALFYYAFSSHDATILEAEYHADIWAFNCISDPVSRMQTFETVKSYYSIMMLTLPTLKEFLNNGGQGESFKNLNKRFETYNYNLSYKKRAKEYSKPLFKQRLMNSNKVPYNIAFLGFRHLFLAIVTLVCISAIKPNSSLSIYWVVFGMLLKIAYDMRFRYKTGFIETVRLRKKVSAMLS
ncbi:hypothetical protein FHW88_000524 [Mucilaginibacter sp. SG538B]|uniref:hypothetical protein n=1 Tax=Mucilaginibacter sp. SG538B TaxID=2587021 RepID=UPI00159D98D3|nr:hypothetical protein [Mucilaginibacter sp. SG538B]NVM62248.1 hypothetical protein [Mucilaginibacter sp. SG538B]